MFDSLPLIDSVVDKNPLFVANLISQLDLHLNSLNAEVTFERNAMFQIM